MHPFYATQLPYVSLFGISITYVTGGWRLLSPASLNRPKKWKALRVRYRKGMKHYEMFKYWKYILTSVLTKNVWQQRWWTISSIFWSLVQWNGDWCKTVEWIYRRVQLEIGLVGGSWCGGWWQEGFLPRLRCRSISYIRRCCRR